MTNLIEYKEGSSFMTASISESWETEIEVGNGNAYGMELLIRRNEGDFTGWIGYTLSWVNRTFENLNFGKPFPYKYDRRHDVSVVGNYKFNDRIDIGVVWVYGSGNALNLPIERYNGFSEFSSLLNPNFQPIEYYKERNGFRMPSYHRLDFGINVGEGEPGLFRQRAQALGALIRAEDGVSRAVEIIELNLRR